MKVFSKANLLLSVICGVLGYFLYEELMRPMEQVLRFEPERGGQTESEPAHAGPQVEAPLPRDHFTQLVERPPFSATRRPPQPRRVVVAAKPQVIPKPKFILVGVFVNSDAGVAVVQKPGTDKQIRLAPGDSIDGWEVMSILPDRITLRSQQETHEVELRKAGSARRP